MYKNYENRVKNFITDMVNPDTKIIIKDITEKIETSRSKLMSESPSTKKPFVFKGYITERDRIKQNASNIRYLHNLSDYNSKSNKNKEIPNNKYISLSPVSNIKINSSLNNSLINTSTKSNNNSIIQKSSTIGCLTPDFETIKVDSNPEAYISPVRKGGRRLSIKEQQIIDYHIKNDIILQPQMKFKARTDLERVYDTLSENYSRVNENEKMVIERQLKSIDKLNYKMPKDFLREKNNLIIIKKIKKQIDNNEKKDGPRFLENPYLENDTKKLLLTKNKSSIYNISKYFYIPKNNSNFEKSWAKKNTLNAEAEEMLKSYHYKIHFKAAEEIAENKIKNAKYLFLLPNIFKNKSSSIINSKRHNNNNNINYKSEEKDEKNNEIYNSFYYKNPIKKRKKYKPELMKKLSEIAFQSDRNEMIENIKTNNNKYKNTKNDNNNNKASNLEESEIKIDGKIYNKNKEFDLITKKILRLCKVYSNKSKNNNQSLKAGNGKSMITQGLSLNSFEKKYKLNK